MTKKRTIQIKNMCCDRCITVVRQTLEGLGLRVNAVKLGQATYSQISTSPVEDIGEKIVTALEQNGFELIVDKDEVSIEIVRTTVMRFVDQLPGLEEKELDIMKLLEQQTNKSYRTLATLFSKHRKMTIEKYIILQKLEKIKDLIDEGKFNFSQISDAMGYKAPQHLAAQFRRVTGMTMNQHKKMAAKKRLSIDKI